MSRRIITTSDAKILRESQSDVSLLDEVPGAQRETSPTVAPSAKPDDYASTLIKLIPSEVVTVFVTLDGIIRTDKSLIPAIYWAIFAVLVVACYFYTRKVTRTDGLPNRASESILACVSFVVWVFAIGGPFTYQTHWDHPVYGAVLLPLYTFLIPLVFSQSQKP